MKFKIGDRLVWVPTDPDKYEPKAHKLMNEMVRQGIYATQIDCDPEGRERVWWNAVDWEYVSEMQIFNVKENQEELYSLKNWRTALERLLSSF